MIVVFVIDETHLSKEPLILLDANGILLINSGLMSRLRDFLCPGNWLADHY